MKRILYIFTAVSIFASCKDDDIASLNEFRDDPAIETLNGTWKMVSLEDVSTGEITLPTRENSWNEDVMISIDDTNDPPRLFGKNTTNHVSGTFDYHSLRSITVHGLYFYVCQPTRLGE